MDIETCGFVKLLSNSNLNFVVSKKKLKNEVSEVKYWNMKYGNYGEQPKGEWIDLTEESKDFFVVEANKGKQRLVREFVDPL